MKARINGSKRKLLLPSDAMASEITLDDYETSEYAREPMDEQMALAFHHFFLTNCLVKITSTNEYMVRCDFDGQKNWIAKGKDKLEKILKRHWHYVRMKDDKGNGKLKRICYSTYLEHPDVAQNIHSFRGRVFAPCAEKPDHFVIWSGHKYAQVDEVNIELIQPFLNHVKEVICNGDEEMYKVEMQKNAWMYQNPNHHMGWATVLIGPEGSGKSIYCSILCNLWGALWSNPNVRIEQVVDDKASTIVLYRKLIVCNELPPTQMTKTEKDKSNTLKARITEDTVKTRRMHKDYADTHDQNVSNYMFCTNNSNCLLMNEGDRRYFVLEVSGMYVRDEKYFNVLVDLSKSREFEQHLLTYFLRMDVHDLNCWHPPLTEAKKQMIEEQEPYSIQYLKLQRWWQLRRRHSDWITLDELWPDYVKWLSDDLAIEPKFGGPRNKFTMQPVRAEWIVKRENFHPVNFCPSPKLLDYWNKLPREPEVEAEKDIEDNIDDLEHSGEGIMMVLARADKVE
jgi:hypothetical protein